MISPKDTTVVALLGLQSRFEVPKFQRPYTWTSTEVEEFLDDLQNEGARGLFLGSVLFDTSHATDGRIAIVDGQQRLTSIFLLLIACRDRAKSFSADLAHETQRMIGFIDPVTAESQGSRLLASESVRDVFEVMANSKWDGIIPTKVSGKQVKRQANRIKSVYQHFANRVENMDLEALQGLLKAVYSARLIRIDIDSDEEAFNLFERTNARGADLEISDLLKNYLYQQSVPKIEEKWKEVLENADSTLTKMLKYFYVSKKGYVNKSDLYRNLKLLGKSEGAVTLIQDLCEFSRFYAVVRKEESETVLKAYLESLEADSIAKYQDRYGQIFLSLQALRLFRVSQTFPLLYSALRCCLKSGGDKDNSQAKLLVELVADLEKYHFINNAICDRVGNEVERLYADFCKEFEASPNFVDTAKKLKTKLLERIAGKTEFISRFCDIGYSQDSIPLICYIFDRINNFDRKPGERVTLYSPNNNRSNHNIEHFLPQKAQKGSDASQPAEDEASDFIDNIGNLLVISFHVNSKLGNESPNDKIAALKGPLKGKVENMDYVTKFIETYEKKSEVWGREAIAERAKAMAADAYDRVWILG